MRKTVALALSLCALAMAGAANAAETDAPVPLTDEQMDRIVAASPFVSGLPIGRFSVGLDPIELDVATRPINRDFDALFDRGIPIGEQFRWMDSSPRREIRRDILFEDRGEPIFNVIVW